MKPFGEHASDGFHPHADGDHELYNASGWMFLQ